MKTINVTMKNVYGNNLVYTACNEAMLLAELSGKITFDKRAIDVLKRLGYEIVVTNGYELKDATK